MNGKLIANLLIAILLATSCSRSASNSTAATEPIDCNGKIDVSYDAGFGNIAYDSIDVLHATWSRQQEGNFVRHAICLRNSYTTGAKVRTATNRTVGISDPAEVCFTINDKPGTAIDYKRDAPISPGEYKQMGRDTGKEFYLPDRLVGAVGHLKNSTVDVNIDSRNSFGWVKVNNSTINTIDGEISFGDGKNKFVGKFFAVTPTK